MSTVQFISSYLGVNHRMAVYFLVGVCPLKAPQTARKSLVSVGEMLFPGLERIFPDIGLEAKKARFGDGNQPGKRSRQVSLLPM
jgi:hypothetical protein